jgi:hypothetical protein
LSRKETIVELDDMDIPSVLVYPAPRLPCIRLVLGLIVEFDLDARHIDVKGAYLQASLGDDEVVYMRRPEVFVNKKNPEKVCKLIKSIYGLRQASYKWFQHLRAWLMKLGFKPFNEEETMYHKEVDGRMVMVTVNIRQTEQIRQTECEHQIKGLDLMILFLNRYL